MNVVDAQFVVSLVAIMLGCFMLGFMYAIAFFLRVGKRVIREHPTELLAWLHELQHEEARG